MAPNQDGRAETLVPGENPSVGARVSTELKAALKLYRQKRNQERSAAEGELSESQIVRDAMDLWVRENVDDFPEEARDMVDEDLEANARDQEEAADA